MEDKYMIILSENIANILDLVPGFKNNPVVIFSLLLFIIVIAIFKIPGIQEIFQYQLKSKTEKNENQKKINQECLDEIQLALYSYVKNIHPADMDLTEIKHFVDNLCNIIRDKQLYNHPLLDSLISDLSSHLEKKKLSRCRKIVSNIRLQIKDEYFRLRKSLGFASTNTRAIYLYQLHPLKRDIVDLLIILLFPNLFFMILSLYISYVTSPNEQFLIILLLLIFIGLFIFLGMLVVDIMFWSYMGIKHWIHYYKNNKKVHKRNTPAQKAASEFGTSKENAPQ